MVNSKLPHQYIFINILIFNSLGSSTYLVNSVSNSEISYKHFSFGTYEVDFSFIDTNSYDMQYNIIGFGDLNTRTLEISLSYLEIFFDNSLIYLKTLGFQYDYLLDGTKTIDVSIPIKVQGNATNNDIDLLQIHNVTILIQYQLSLVTSRQPITQSGFFSGTKILKIQSPSNSSSNKGLNNLNRMAFSAVMGFFFYC